jgi:hypothetical protein
MPLAMANSRHFIGFVIPPNGVLVSLIGFKWLAFARHTVFSP